MNFRIKADNLPNIVLENIGAIADKAILRIKELSYIPEKQQLTFLFNRFPIIGKSFFSNNT